MVQSGLLVAESEPILALVEAVYGLQIQDVFLPLTKTQEDRGADRSLQPVHNGVPDCSFQATSEMPLNVAGLALGQGVILCKGLSLSYSLQHDWEPDM